MTGMAVDCDGLYALLRTCGRSADSYPDRGNRLFMCRFERDDVETLCSHFIDHATSVEKFIAFHDRPRQQELLRVEVASDMFRHRADRVMHDIYNALQSASKFVLVQRIYRLFNVCQTHF